MEAHNALHYALNTGFPLDGTKVEELADRATDTSHAEWLKMKEPCIFLHPDTGDCGVYPVRPNACRAISVYSDPKECKTHNFSAVKRYDTRLMTQKTMVMTQGEHQELALTPYVAALPLMVQLLLESKGPADLQPLVNDKGVVLGEEKSRNTRPQ